jgi:hypothetical protein
VCINANEITSRDKDYTLIDLLPTNNDNSSMKDELKNFLKNQMSSTSMKPHSSNPQGISDTPSYYEFK